MCPNIQFHNLKNWESIEETYKHVYTQGGIHVIVEYPEFYYS